jgi:hypothetical protein
MTNTIAYRGKDCPIDVGGTFLKRVQSAEFGRNIPTENVMEMGRDTPVGVTQDVFDYTCRIVANTIANTELEDALSGTTNPTLSDYAAAAGVTIKGPYGGISGAKVMRIEYVATAGTGAMQSTFELEGTGWTSGSVATPALDALAAAYVGKDVEVNVGAGGSNEVFRAQRVTVQATLNRARVNELHNADPVGYAYDPPTVTVEIEIFHSDVASQPTLWNSDPASPVDIVVLVGGVKTLTIADCISTGQPTAGNVRGWATQRYSYMAKTGSLVIS